jgi:hypothetical protein
VALFILYRRSFKIYDENEIFCLFIVKIISNFKINFNSIYNLILSAKFLLKFGSEKQEKEKII